MAMVLNIEIPLHSRISMIRTNRGDSLTYSIRLNTAFTFLQFF